MAVSETGLTLAAFLLMTVLLETVKTHSVVLNEEPHRPHNNLKHGSTCEWTVETGAAGGVRPEPETLVSGTSRESTAEDCLLPEIRVLLIQSQVLDVMDVPQFVQNLSQTVESHQKEIHHSALTILRIVDILKAIAEVSSVVTAPIMENVLKTVDVLVAEEASESWFTLNENRNLNASSGLLGALEDLSEALEGEFSITTRRILLKRTTLSNSSEAELNPSVTIEVPVSNQSVFLTSISLSSVEHVMPTEPSHDTDIRPFYGFTSSDLVLVKVNTFINQNVSLIFKNNSLYSDKFCVFWNFSLDHGLGSWDDEGCTLVSDTNGTVLCSCNHLTTFTILNPPLFFFTLEFAPYIYFGVVVSVLCTLTCLIIEGCVWRAVTTNSTALMRHVSIINTAVCLFIRDVCFMAQVFFFNYVRQYYELDPPCTTVTFVRHVFDLALFFWMLVSCLLLFYRTSMVFSDMSKSKMLSVGLSLGYGAPLLIAAVTVAATAPGDVYLGRDYCWLNWDEAHTLLALVVPVLSVVFINITLLSVVLFKIVRSGRVTETDQHDDRQKLVVRLVFLLISFLLFGLTCALSLGTVLAPDNLGIYVSFAVFSSLQGLWILVFGPLYDSKIRLILSRKCQKTPDKQHGNN